MSLRNKMCSSLCPPCLRLTMTAKSNSIVRVWVVNNSAGSRPWDKGESRLSRFLSGGGRSWKKIFSALWVSVWSKNNRWPGPLLWIRYWIKLRDEPCTRSAAELFIRSPLDHLASLSNLGGTAHRVRWTIRNVMGEGVGELQNKYSCKREINWKIKRNVNKNSFTFPRIYCLISKCLLTDRFLNTTKMALKYSLICSAWKLTFNLLQLH